MAEDHAPHARESTVQVLDTLLNTDRLWTPGVPGRRVTFSDKWHGFFSAIWHGLAAGAGCCRSVLGSGSLRCR
jgi:hypothetical protein